MSIIVRTYVGKGRNSAQDAAKKYAADAHRLAAQGYAPVSVVSSSEKGAHTFVLGGLGLLAPTTLTVTYQLTEAWIARQEAKSRETVAAWNAKQEAKQEAKYAEDQAKRAARPPENEPCPACGQRLSPAWDYLCRHCGTLFSDSYATDRGRTFFEQALSADTDGWTAPTVVRVYAHNPRGSSRFDAERALLGEHGYAMENESRKSSHIHIGRLLVTGGLSALAGRSGVMSEGRTSVTFARTAPVAETPTEAPRAAPPIPDPLEQLRRLGELRDAGVLSADEFDAKKAEILRRV